LAHHPALRDDGVRRGDARPETEPRAVCVYQSSDAMLRMM
jgi:hypothetical protein